MSIWDNLGLVYALLGAAVSSISWQARALRLV